ncbi:Peptidyl-tRNA hydrolase [Alphaproteobacteria bacterium]
MRKKVIVGLGNYGVKYQNNRHNVGFQVVDAIAGVHKLNFTNGFYGKVSKKQSHYVLLKPETYMNNSGVSVRALLQFFKLHPRDVVVIHDDIDLEIGRVKIKVGGHHCGHNGLKSIDDAIGTEYTRIRFGIGHPRVKEQVPEYVLADFSPTEKNIVHHIINVVVDNVEALVLEGDKDAFMNKCSMSYREYLVKG